MRGRHQGRDFGVQSRRPPKNRCKETGSIESMGAAALDQPLVSVVIPTFNRAYCIAESIESVLAQSYSNIEVIVVDDGSDDNTRTVVESIEDCRVRYIYQGNAGACVARNRGIDESIGDYIAFHDSDDLWYPRKLELQLGEMRKTNASCCICRMKVIDKDQNSTRIVPSAVPSFEISDLLKSNYISTQMLLCNRECFASERFDPLMPRLQDWDLAIRLVQKEKFAFCDEVLVEQRIRKDSISRSYEKVIAAAERLLSKYPELYQIHSGARTSLYGLIGWGYDNLGEYESAIATYKKRLDESFSLKILAKLLQSRILNTVHR